MITDRQTNMPAEPVTRSEASEREQTERLVEFRLGAAWMGMLILVAGLVLVGTIFFQVWSYMRNPDDLRGYLDRWEAVVRGSQNTFGSAVEQRAVGPSPAGHAEPPAETSIQNRPETIIANAALRVFALSSRPLAILILLFLAGVLVRIAVGIVHAGTQLVQLSVSEQRLLKRLVDEIKRP